MGWLIEVFRLAMHSQNIIAYLLIYLVNAYSKTALAYKARAKSVKNQLEILTLSILQPLLPLKL
jgi:hypothetical protein